MKSRRVIGGLKTTSSIDEEGLALLSGAVRLEVEGPASTDCACAREETISAGALATGTNMLGPQGHCLIHSMGRELGGEEQT